MEHDTIYAIILSVYLIFTTIMAILCVVWLLKYRNLSSRFSGVINAEDREKTIHAGVRGWFDEQRKHAQELASKIEALRQDYLLKRKLLGNLEEALRPLEDAHNLAEDGFQEPKFQLEDHAEYIAEIKRVRESQKDAVRAKKAVVGRTDWTVGDSKTEGRKMVGRAVRMVLRAFNNECDSRIGKVNWKNIEQVKKRISASRDALNKLNESLHVEITPEYLSLKFREADLVNEEKIKKEKERNLLREKREQEKEEARAQREIMAELKRQEAQQKEKQQTLLTIREKLKTASAEHRGALEAEAHQLEEELAAAALSKGRLLSMAEHTRIGHLYVISNRGAFGKRMIKIGMTRRLDPLLRVKELGDASVPFPFDVHAMVFSEDAPQLERDLHERFNAHRVNRVNRRKEFFNIPLDQVHSELEVRIPGVPFEYDAPSMEFAGSQPSTEKGVAGQSGVTSNLPQEI